MSPPFPCASPLGQGVGGFPLSIGLAADSHIPTPPPPPRAPTVMLRFKVSWFKLVRGEGEWRVFGGTTP